MRRDETGRKGNIKSIEAMMVKGHDEIQSGQQNRIAIGKRRKEKKRKGKRKKERKKNDVYMTTSRMSLSLCDQVLDNSLGFRSFALTAN